MSGENIEAGLRPQEPRQETTDEALKTYFEISPEKQIILYKKLASFLTGPSADKQLWEKLNRVRSIKFEDLQGYLCELGTLLPGLPDSIWRDTSLIEQFTDHRVFLGPLSQEKESYLSSEWLQNELAQVLESTASVLKGDTYDKGQYQLARWLHDLSAFLCGPLLLRALEIAQGMESRDSGAHASSAILASLARLENPPEGYQRKQVIRDVFVEALLDNLSWTAKAGGPGALPPYSPPSRGILGEKKRAKPPRFSSAAAGVLMDADLSQAIDEIVVEGDGEEEKTDLRPVHERVVNTVFTPRDQPEQALDKEMPLTSGRRYYFCLWVGEQDPESIEMAPTAIPVEHLPKEALLRVALFGFENEIEITPGADVGELKLLPDGTAKVARQPLQKATPPLPLDLRGQRLFFPVATPAGSGTFRFRCHIYFEQLLVQSRLIYAQVTDQPKTAAGALRSVVDYTLSHTLSPAHLNNLRSHRLSLMLNSNGDETHAFFFGRNGNLTFKSDATISAAGLKNPIERVRKALRKASWGDTNSWTNSPPQYYHYRNHILDMTRLKEDMTSMAIVGFDLYDALIDKLAGSPTDPDELADLMRVPGQVQIALKQSPTHVLPAALFYDYPLDTQARHHQLCDAFIESLQHKEPLEKTICFKGTCPNYGKVDHICPSGFWGYRHFLGIPVSKGDTEESTQGKDVAPEIVLKGQINVVAGLASNLDLVDEHSLKLESLCGKPGWHPSYHRSEILDRLKMGKPHVIYFYCHGVSVGNTPFLQVGNGDEFIEGSNLRAFRIRWDDPRPLVFINGCHTTALDPEQAFNLVQAFVNRGGAGVIGTEITVFEPLASVFAEECLRLFLSGKASIGEAIRSTRLKLLKEEGNPLGLVYTPFVIPSLYLKKG